MATIGDLKKVVLAYAGRKDGDVTIDGVDYVFRAINNAKDFAQRSVDFEFARTTAQILNVSLVNGGNLASATLFGTATPVKVKKIEKVWLSNAAATAQFPIRIMSRDSYVERMRKRYEHVTSTREADSLDLSGVTPNQITYVQVGQTFFIYPASQSVLGGATVNVYFDIIEWIPDFDDAGDTHFLLDYCFDFLQFRSILELNFLLKEDMRVRISDAYMERIWNNVINWNSTVIGSQTDDVSLD